MFFFKPTIMTKSKSLGKTGVLLVNLGTPDSPNTPDVRKYLRQFLMDGRVIDIPYLSRWLLINLIIAPFRAPKSAKIYKELWTENGSPLKFYGHRVEQLLRDKLEGEQYVIKLAMRYQSPSIDTAIDEFKQLGLSKIIVVPFFPQYASASTGSVYEEVMRLISKWQVIPEISFVNSFHSAPKFIQCITENAKKEMAKHNYDYFVFSYHGIPERQIMKGDCGNVCKFGSCCDSLNAMNQLCYRAQCFETTRHLVKALNIPEGKYITSFQSRLGRTPWIKPYTDEIIKELPKQGFKNVLAFSPSFVSDCLETTIEVGDEYKELFEESGGEHWQLVESLNDNPLWVDLLTELIENQR